MSWQSTWIARVALAALALQQPAAALRRPPEGDLPDAGAAVVSDRGSVPDLGWIGKSAYAHQRICQDLGQAAGVPKCVMGTEEKCALSSLRSSGSTMVYPGGKTRCLNWNKPSYAFQVFPGRRDQLHIVFDGGGAEWDELSTSVGAANKTFVWPQKEAGFLRRDAAENPFRDYTTVFVQYCSGDLHSGQADQAWKDRQQKPVLQRGYQNTLSTVNWALANMEPVLESLVISGVSAGSIAAALWASKLLQTFTYVNARIWGDSYVPVFPPSFQGKIFKRLGFCELDLLQGRLMEKCKQSALTVEEVFIEAMKEHPKVGFGSVTSGRDGFQTKFYQMTAVTQGRMNEYYFFTPENFHAKACEMFSKYHKNPNYVSFMLDLDVHVLSLCNDAFSWEVNVGGPTSKQRLPFWKWMSMFLEPDSAVQSVLDIRNPKARPRACEKSLGTKALHLKA